MGAYGAAGKTYVILGKAAGWLGEFGLGDLASGDGSAGFVLNGAVAGDQSGIAVSGGGDINGDGFDDIIIGASNADPNGANSGETYVVFGKASWSAEFELSTLDGGDGSTGFVLNGIDASDQTGIRASSAGDVNGDGYDDILANGYMAAPNGNTWSGETYLVFGKAGGWAAEFELSTLAGGDGSTGVQFNGIDIEDYSGIALSSAGDVNNDGYDDILISTNWGDPNGSESGETYLILGTDDWSEKPVLELGEIEDPSGCSSNACPALVEVTLDDTAEDISWNVVNQDGKKILVGGDYTAADDNTADNRNYALPRGNYSYEATLWDATGDGFDTGAAIYKLGIPSAVFSKDDTDAFEVCTKTFTTDSSCGFNNGGTANMTCGAQCEPITGVRLAGISDDDLFGYSVGGGGDVNGDGYDDFVIGAPKRDTGGTDTGEVYLIYGKADGWPTDIDLSALDGTDGVAFYGIGVGDETGTSVSIGGDVNGDGYDDMLFGTPNATYDTSEEGGALLVFGGGSYAALTDIDDMLSVGTAVALAGT